MSKEFEALNRDDVVSVGSDETYLVSHTTFKVAELLKLMRDSTARSERQKGWFGEGIDCEILKPGAKSWQKGKVRVILEFCPDEPESPLDDIRQQLKQAES